LNKTQRILLFLIVCFSFSCEKEKLDDVLINKPYLLEYPAGFQSMKFPEGNELTTLRVALGKQLFFDKRLSRDSTVSCGSCHFQQHAFADFNQLSTGIDNREGFRNSPTLVNLGYHPYFFFDGGVPTLELQILAPIEDENEMDFSVPAVIDRLKNDAAIQELSQLAYGRSFDPFVLTRSIAAFERTLISGNSRFDQYYYQGKSSALNDSEKRGMELFFSNKTNCSTCHSGFNFSNYDFTNIGLYEFYADSGRTRITIDPADRGKFKTPTLRNIAVTATYMHEGSLNTLEVVIEHFNSGGKNHPSKDTLIKPLNLTATEKTDLVNFLKALTDDEFLNNLKFKE
jgi:cytochrome c peroxidase